MGNEKIQSDASVIFDHQVIDSDIENYCEENNIENYEIYDINEESDSQYFDVDINHNEFKERFFINPSTKRLDILFDYDSLEESSEPLTLLACGFPEQIAFADINNDNFTDIMVRSKHGLHVFLNRSVDDKTENDFIQGEAVLGVPEYERTGVAHISTGYFSNTYEYVSDKTFDVSWLVNNNNKLYQISNMLKAILPERFRVGLIDDNNMITNDFSELPDRLKNFGVNIKMERSHNWIQDELEYAMTADGKVVNAMVNFNDDGKSGGNITYVKNENGELFVFITYVELYKIRQRLFEMKHSLTTREDEIRNMSISLGVNENNIIILPEIEGFVHSDQYIFVPQNGVAITLKLPEEHPSYSEWELAKQNLRELGFKIIDVEIPDYYLRNVRSSFNIFVQKDPVTQRVKYIIPLDPSFIIISDYQRSNESESSDTVAVIDLLNDRLNLINVDSNLNTIIKHPFNEGVLMRSVDREDDPIAIYDTNNLPDHIKRIYEAIRDSGVDIDDIIIFPHNAYGNGSLHCISNTEPR